MKRRSLIVTIALSLFAGIGMTVASAEPPSPANPAGPMLGVVPVHGDAGVVRAAAAGSNLTYHNGPVMTSNTTYAIYWSPAGYAIPTSYQTVINRFFTDVALDSNLTTNVYYSTAQYYSLTNKTVKNQINYNSTFGGSYVDTAAFPAGGCAANASVGTTICLTDAQLRTEIQSVVSKAGWSAASNKLFFLFTPKGVGSCSGSSCSFTQYCAYHSWIGSGSSAVLYANMPYANTYKSCSAGVFPNNVIGGDPDADATINVTSHEHAEAITDPQGNAWYNNQGKENGDLCAWNFGGATSANQTINGNPYYLQQEWSNKSSKCVLSGQ